MALKVNKKQILFSNKTMVLYFYNMGIKGFKIGIIIGIVALSTIGLIWIQYNWIQDSFKTNNEIFRQKVDVTSGLLNKVFERNNTLKRKIIEELEQTKKLSNATQKRFETMLDSIMFHKIGLKENFNYGIYQHAVEHYEFIKVFGRGAQDRLRLEGCPTECEKNNFGWVTIEADHNAEDHYHNESHMDHFHLAVFFPPPDSYVFSETKMQFLSSFAFILLILGSFVFAIFTIKKQKKLSELKNDFINNLTHEFKTPIFSIELAGSILNKAPEIRRSEKLTRYLGVIDSEAKRLQTQLDKVLQVALIDSDNFQLEKKELDLNDVIQSVVKNFKFLVEDRGGTLEVLLTAKKKILFADETHLKNIIYNLLDNSLKYSPEKPTLKIVTQDTSEGLILIIEDEGIGIEENKQKYIFDKFYRVNSGDVHDVKGFGLGLSYVKSIVDAHGAKINIQSKVQVGTKFILTFSN